MKIVKLTKTCDAMPAQWEGYTIDEEPIYIRYRWGYLSVRVGPKNGNVWDAVGSEEVYGQRIGEGFDGDLSYSELKELLSTQDFQLPELEEVRDGKWI